MSQWTLSNSNRSPWLCNFLNCDKMLQMPDTTAAFSTPTKAVCPHHCPDCLSYPANAIPVGQATWATWVSVKKYSLNSLTKHVKELGSNP